ncbi:unnamed protein product [Auanema sp. JU1783]|nr:unnamed protein product [Auanema sp. JU1783]
MSNSASVLENPIIINQKVVVTVLEPKSDDVGSAVPVSKELFLKIEERKLDNNEKEFRVEVSHPDDFLFLFGEGITRQKYQVLAEKWNVESEFEDFFKVLLSRIIKEADAGQSTQLKCVLSLDRTYCTFEFAKKQDFYIARMPMELTIVTGEALLQHLMNTIRHLRRSITSLSSYKSNYKELRESKNELLTQLERQTEELSSLKREIKHLQEENDELERKKMEAENDCQITSAELETLRDTNEDLMTRVEELEADKMKLNDEIDEFLRERDDWDLERHALEDDLKETTEEKVELESMIGDLKDQLQKSDHILQKYLKPDVVSFDASKLDELSKELKDKDEIIQQLTGVLSKSKEQLQKTGAELEATKLELAKSNNSLSTLQNMMMYRTSLSGQSPIVTRNAFPSNLNSTPGVITNRTNLMSTLSPIATTAGCLPRVPDTPLHSRKVPTPIFNKLRSTLNKDK